VRGAAGRPRFVDELQRKPTVREAFLSEALCLALFARNAGRALLGFDAGVSDKFGVRGDLLMHEH
jgi:hypothetical protein